MDIAQSKIVFEALDLIETLFETANTREEVRYMQKMIAHEISCRASTTLGGKPTLNACSSRCDKNQ